jgi:hypothetical protein
LPSASPPRCRCVCRKLRLECPLALGHYPSRRRRWSR